MTIIYFHVYMILDFPITNRNASEFCQSECTCLHRTVNIEVFLTKYDGNTWPKERALMQMYRVVAQTKRGIGGEEVWTYREVFLDIHWYPTEKTTLGTRKKWS